MSTGLSQEEVERYLEEMRKSKEKEESEDGR